MATRIVLAMLVLALRQPLSAVPEQQPVPVEQEPAHKLVFSNSEVQVLDVVIPPGATTRFHIHSHDLAGLTVSSAPSRNELLGQAPTFGRPDSEGEVWFQSVPEPFIHRVTNLGEKAIHLVVFQLLRPASHTETPPASISPFYGQVALSNSSVGIARIDLAPGAIAPPHAHDCDYGIVAGNAGRLSDDGGPSTDLGGAAFVVWKTASSKHTLRNLGNEPLTIFEFEIRR